MECLSSLKWQYDTGQTQISGIGTRARKTIKDKTLIGRMIVKRNKLNHSK